MYRTPFVVAILLVLALFSIVLWALWRGPSPIVVGKAEGRILGELILAWPELEKNLPSRPVLGSVTWNYPTTVQFLSARRMLVEYEDGHVLRYSVLEHDGRGFIHLETFEGDVLSAEDWQNLYVRYGDSAYSPRAYVFSPEAVSETVSVGDWVLADRNPFLERSGSYANEGLGISFAYPIGLDVMRDSEDLWSACQSFTLQNVTGCVSFIRVLLLGGQAGRAEVEDRILNDFRLDVGGTGPLSINDFQTVQIGNYMYYRIRAVRTEGVLSYRYYLPVGNRVYVFVFTTRGARPAITADEENDPGHLLLKQILPTVRLAP
jgi:hypothetical protein